MKKFVAILASVLMLSLLLFAFHRPQKVTKHNNSVSAANGFAVVELYTSEGCSSCPAADEAVADMAKAYPQNVFVLGFHVDYWNKLGWKDIYSSASYTQRQEAYAALSGADGIYTPQVVVNGGESFTGSDRARLSAAVKSALATAPRAQIEVSAIATDLSHVLIKYSANENAAQLLSVALVQQHASSVVSRGENKGKTLQHIDIVRAFNTVKAGKGTVSLLVPEGVSPKDCQVVAFLQDAHNLHINAAARAVITEN